MELKPYRDGTRVGFQMTFHGVGTFNLLFDCGQEWIGNLFWDRLFSEFSEHLERERKHYYDLGYKYGRRRKEAKLTHFPRTWSSIRR